MSLTGNYTPVNLNCLGALVKNSGLNINPSTEKIVGLFVGTDLVNAVYYPGTLMGDSINFDTTLGPQLASVPVPAVATAYGTPSITILAPSFPTGVTGPIFKVTGVPGEKILINQFRMLPQPSKSLYTEVHHDYFTIGPDGTYTYKAQSNSYSAFGTYYMAVKWFASPGIRNQTIQIATDSKGLFFNGADFGSSDAVNSTLNKPIIIGGVSTDGSQLPAGSITTNVVSQITLPNFLTKLPAIFNYAFELAYPTIGIGAIKQGRTYIIKSLGDKLGYGPQAKSDFTALGASVNVVGTQFVANTTPTDTTNIFGYGTVYNVNPDTTNSDPSKREQGGLITKDTYNRLITMGAGFCELLGNSVPTNAYSRTIPLVETKYGFLGQFAIQAWKEFYINNGSYSDFLNTFNTCMSTRDQNNKVIDSFTASLTYLDGIYSNMNDLITGDITGVNSSTFFWGQDIIASGRAIDLLTIDRFGDPEILLRTLNKNKAITSALNLALLSAGLSATEVSNILNGVIPTNQQRKYMYNAFNLIIGVDLNDVLLPINCQTKGLKSLADLLDPKMLFPTSYSSLTFPRYNTQKLPTNSKTYFLLYSTDGKVNVQPNISYGNRLITYLPPDIAYACDAFSEAMMQIKNVKSMDIEKFGQVVSNLENVNGLNVNGTNIPTDIATVTAALASVAKGSDIDNKYNMKDFFGCMTNFYPFDKLDAAIKEITKFDLTPLTQYYDQIFTIVSSGSTNAADYATLPNLITYANEAIQTLYFNAANTNNVNLAPTVTLGTPGLFVLRSNVGVGETYNTVYNKGLGMAQDSTSGTGGTTDIGTRTDTRAFFIITSDNLSYNVTLASMINNSYPHGKNYQVNDTITFLGTRFGGATPANDLVITVTEVSNGVDTGDGVAGSIINFTFTGTPGLPVKDQYVIELTGTAGESVSLYIFYEVPNTTNSGSNIIPYLGIVDGEASVAYNVGISPAAAQQGVMHVTIGSDGSYKYFTSFPNEGTYWIMAYWDVQTGGRTTPVVITTGAGDNFFSYLPAAINASATKTRLDKPIIAGNKPSNGETINYIVTGGKTNLITVNPLNSAAKGVIDNAYSIYKLLASSLQTEQNARDLALPTGTNDLVTNVHEVYSFMDNISTYAIDTDPFQTSMTLENISANNIGGTNLIASLREVRNAQRLNLMGGQLDNDVVKLPLVLPKASSQVANITLLHPDGSIVPGNVTIVSGTTTVPGSTGGTTASTLIPNNLSITNLVNNGLTVPILSPTTAVHDVTLCNCDCWELVK